MGQVPGFGGRSILGLCRKRINATLRLQTSNEKVTNCNFRQENSSFCRNIHSGLVGVDCTGTMVGVGYQGNQKRPKTGAGLG